LLLYPGTTTFRSLKGIFRFSLNVFISMPYTVYKHKLQLFLNETDIFSLFLPPE